MHEMSICEGVVQILEDEAQRHGFARVTKVRLEIGQFAAVEPEALRFSFDVVTKGGVADGAALEIVPVEGRAWCFDCAATVAVASRVDPCPSCGGARLNPTSGDELRVKDLEVV